MFCLMVSVVVLVGNGLAKLVNISITLAERLS